MRWEKHQPASIGLKSGLRQALEHTSSQHGHEGRQEKDDSLHKPPIFQVCQHQQSHVHSFTDEIVSPIVNPFEIDLILVPIVVKLHPIT